MGVSGVLPANDFAILEQFILEYQGTPPVFGRPMRALLREADQSLWNVSSPGVARLDFSPVGEGARGFELYMSKAAAEAFCARVDLGNGML